MLVSRISNPKTIFRRGTWDRRDAGNCLSRNSSKRRQVLQSPVLACPHLTEVPPDCHEPPSCLVMMYFVHIMYVFLDLSARHRLVLRAGDRDLSTPRAIRNRLQQAAGRGKMMNAPLSV
jgi:hypothetical protein